MNKPPLKILLVTVLFSAVGESELVARIPDAVFGLVTISLVYLFAARRYGVGTGLLAATVLLGAESYLVIHGVRDSTQDSLIALFAFVLVWAWISFRVGSSPNTRGWWVAVVVVVAVGLCKNAMGILFALTLVGIEVVQSVLRRRRSEGLAPALRLMGVAVVATAVYSVVMLIVTDGRFAAKLVEDLFVRATVGLGPDHIGGPLYYGERLIGDFGWWLLLLVPGAAVATGVGRKVGEQTAGILFGWTLIFLLGFSMSVSKLPWYVYPVYPTISLLIAFGALQIVTTLRSRVVKALFLVVIILGSGMRLEGVRRVVAEDIRVIDVHRLVDALETVEDRQVIVDHPSIGRHGWIREWNRYYLGTVKGAQWLTRGNRRFQIDTGECAFLACGDPESYPPTSSHPWRPIVKLRKLEPRAADIWIIGTCDLEVPGVLGFDEEFWDGLITAEGFEDRDFGGLEVGSSTGDRQAE